MSTPEGIVKKKLRHKLLEWKKEHGLYYQSINDRFRSGLPDFLLVWKGQAMFVEAKAPNKTLRPLQKYEAMKLINAGALYFVATTKEGKLCMTLLTSGESQEKIQRVPEFFSGLLKDNSKILENTQSG